MTTVFFDTNIVMNESFLRSASAQAFFKACALLKISVIVPEVVIDEVKGNFPKMLNERLSSHKKSHKALAKLLDIDEPKISAEEEVAKYYEWLERFLEEHDITIIPYPDITPKELVVKSYESAKPFKDTGEGHKDYIIWKSIKGHIESKRTSAPNYFLVNNAKDFCVESDEKKTVLHPDLANQITDEAQRPEVFPSIRTLFNERVAPMLEGVSLDEIPDLGIQAIDTIARGILEEDLSGYTAYGFEGVPFSNEVSANVVGEATVKGRELKKIDGEVLITVTGTVPIEVDGFMEKHAYYSEEDSDANIYVSDRDWNDWVMAVSTTVETAFELVLFYSLESKEIVGHSLNLPQEIEDEYPYK